MRTSELKKQATICLNDCWAQAVAVAFILLAVYAVFTFLQGGVGYLMQLLGRLPKSDFSMFSTNPIIIVLNSVGIALNFFVLAPIYMGAVWWYLHCVRGENNKLGDIFVCFSNGYSYLKVLAITFVSWLLRLLMILPSLVCIYGEYRLLLRILSQSESGGLMVLFILGGIFTLCLFGLGIMAMLRLALVDFLYVINPDLKIGELILTSNKRMKNNTKGIIVLAVSFLPWLPAVLFVFPLFFLVPYFAMSYTVFMNNCME